MRGEDLDVDGVGEAKGEAGTCLREENYEGVEHNLVGAIDKEAEG